MIFRNMVTRNQKVGACLQTDELIMCNTNNGTGRTNEELKYEDLNGCIYLPISELLTIIIEEFLPRRYERYVEMNVQFSSGFKKYQNIFPALLKSLILKKPFLL